MAKKKPTMKVTNLATPTRDGNKICATWAIPTAARANADQFSGVDAWFNFNASRGPNVSVESRKEDRNVYGDSVWVRDGGYITHFEQAYDRAKYHPLANGRHLNSVSVGVAGWNNGPGTFGPKVWATYQFQPPRTPAVAEPEVNLSNSHIKARITSDAGADQCERYDTMYCVMRQDSANLKTAYATARALRGWSSAGTSSEFTTPEYDIGFVEGLGVDQWSRITFRAYSRGIRGDSAVSESSHVFAHPAQAKITGINVSEVSATGLVTVRISVGASTYRPVDSVQLQMLKDTDAATAAEAAFQSWSDVDGALDDDDCNGLSHTVADAMPQRGKRTWYRVKTVHDSLVAYSLPVEASALYRALPTAEDDSVAIASCTSGADGRSLEVVLGWDEDDSTGTEVSWSVHPDAWESTERPSTYNVTWADPEPRADGYANTAKLVIRGLEEGVPVYVKARRYLESQDGTTYGGYATAPASQLPATPVTRPSDVSLVAPAFVPRGSGIPLAWTFGGGAAQAGWQVLSMPSMAVLASGDGPSGGCTLPASAYGDSASIGVAVLVTTGGEWASSQVAEVGVADPPSVGLDVPATLAAQPLAFTANSADGGCDLVVKVLAGGVSRELPGGTSVQAGGDVVWSGRISPAWSASGTGFSAHVELPAGLDLVDTASYTVSAVAVDPATGLSSDAVEASLSVAWAHQAAAPSGSVVPDAALLRCDVFPESPEGAADADRCDVYRVTPDGAEAIAVGVEFGSTVRDRFAPFGSADLRYRLCTRTADGDIEWADVPYELRHHGSRFDWDGGSLELPWNLKVDDSYSKDFEEAAYLDGTVSGSWNAGVSRRLSLGSDMMRGLDDSQAESLRAMARHPGPVFVRLRNGVAFEADVEVEGLSEGYSGVAMPVSIAATGLTLTPAFACDVNDVAPPGVDIDDEGDGDGLG